MNIAMIGLGMVSGTYADALAKTDAPLRLKGVHARSVESRDAFVAKHPDFGAKAYPSLDAIADDPDIEFVIVTTPPNARVEIVQKLAAAGKHILMEKPVERTLEAATNLVETCEAAGVMLGIMLQHRARPVVADLRSVLDAGTLGPLAMVEINVPWWRNQAYYDEPGRGTYTRDGGGVLISQAIHTLDLALTLTGPVSEVVALTATSALHQMEAEDFVSAGLRFENGAIGQLFATTASNPGRGETITLHFANGSAHIDTNLLQITWKNGSVETFGATTASGAGADPMAFTSDWHRTVIEDFAQSIQSGTPPLIPGRDALKVHSLIAAIEASGKSKSVVTPGKGTAP